MVINVGAVLFRTSVGWDSFKSIHAPVTKVHTKLNSVVGVQFCSEV